MELNYITFIQGNLASFFDFVFEFIQKMACQKQINQSTFIKETKNDKLTINLLEKDYIQVTTSQSTPKVSL